MFLNQPPTANPGGPIKIERFGNTEIPKMVFSKIEMEIK